LDLFWTYIYIYIYCTYHNYHDTNAFCSMWLSSLVTLVLNSAHGTRTTCIDDNRKHQSCRRWWCRVTLHVVAYNVLMVTETVTVVIVQSTTMKQSYSHSVIWRLTVSVHPFPSIHWLTFILFIHSPRRHRKITLLVPWSWVTLLSDPYNNFIQNFYRLRRNINTYHFDYHRGHVLFSSPQLRSSPSTTLRYFALNCLIKWAPVHEHASYLLAFIDYIVWFVCYILTFINSCMMNS